MSIVGKVRNAKEGSVVRLPSLFPKLGGEQVRCFVRSNDGEICIVSAFWWGIHLKDIKIDLKENKMEATK